MSQPEHDPPESPAVRLAASILAADFAELGAQVRAAVAGGADWIHIDVMDGHFVPNISIGPMIVEACRRVTDSYLDVHLMITQPERYVAAFAAAGADGLTVHAEACTHLHRTLAQIREAGMQPGVAVNPLTPLGVYQEALPYCRLALIMTVNPGFGGQRFIPGSLGRIARLRELRDRLEPDCLIEVDGGIDPTTAPQVVQAGAQVLVAGSAVFGGGRIAENLQRLRESVAGATA